MFLHFYAFEHLIRGNQQEFFMVRSGLEKYHPRKKEYFWLISESRLTGFFLINYGEPLYKHTSKLKYFPSPLDITQFRNTNDFLLLTRSELVSFWNFRCRKRSNKSLLQLWLLRALLKFLENISRNQCGCIY